MGTKLLVVGLTSLLVMTGVVAWFLTDGKPEVAIYDPRDGAVLEPGHHGIIGVADSPDFIRYRLERANSSSPDEWHQAYSSGGPVRDGPRRSLGGVDVMDPGVYKIRLVVEDAKLGELVEEIEVTVVDSP